MTRQGGKHRRGRRIREQRHQVDEIVLQADLPAAQRARFEYEPDWMPNPYGEVTQAGQIRRHKVCRRVPQHELLFRAKVFDKAVFAALEWFDDQLAIAEKGAVKCALNVTGGGGPGGVTFDEAAAAARRNVDWARASVRGLLSVFDAVMIEGESFSDYGARRWPALARDWSRRKAASEFKAAASLFTDSLRTAGLLPG